MAVAALERNYSKDIAKRRGAEYVHRSRSRRLVSNASALSGRSGLQTCIAE
jgi:hypothetical protein